MQQSPASSELKKILDTEKDQRLADAHLRILEDIRQAKVEFEFDGWHVFLGNLIGHSPTKYALELKPQVGDDSLPFFRQRTALRL